MSINVHLGNLVPIDAGNRQPIDGSQITEVRAPEGKPAEIVVAEIVDHIWPRHSLAPAPAWVASNVLEVAEVLADHYGCPVRGYEEV